MKVLNKAGFKVVHQKGSHIYLADQNKRHKLSVPRHDPIGKGLLMEIIAEAGLTREEFLELLEKV
ncbi:MAG: type II toxin-antitoxin system HicA family toxin [Nitrososphaerales archaeon]|nr:type II toxin-antitoxin system HicA family toxin [Nitrososphaerales archaeon]